MAQIETTIRLEMDASKQTYLDLFRTAGMRRRALIGMMLGFFTQWSGNTLISYYMMPIMGLLGIKDSNRKQQINLGNQCWSLVNATTIALIVTRFPRRRIFLICTIGMTCCYVGWTVTMGIYQEGGSRNEAAGIMALFFIFLYSPWYNIGYNSLTYTYLVELFPYAERTRGIALFQFFSRGANFFSTFVNPIALDAIAWKYLIVFSCWVAFEVAFIYFFFPETHNRTLEELAFLSEGQEIQDQQAIATAKQMLRQLDNETEIHDIAHEECRHVESTHASAPTELK